MSTVSMAEYYIRESLELNLFWTRIIKEHFIFMQANLMYKDISYIQQAEEFKCLFEGFLHQTIYLSDDDAKPPINLGQMTSESRRATVAIRDFKAASTEMLLACQLKGVMTALLTDHLLREANYYLRIINRGVPEFKGGKGWASST